MNRKVKPEWYEFALREKNFHGDFKTFKKFIIKNNNFIEKLYKLNQSIQSDLEETKELDRNKVLKSVFTKIYTSVVMEHETYKFFRLSSKNPFCVYDECLFTLLATFIMRTKHIESMSIRDFLYKHSPNRYNDKKSEFYFDITNPDTPSDIIITETNTLRKWRHRIFSVKSSYIIRDNWSGIPIVAENDLSHIYRSYIYDFKKSNDKELRHYYKTIENIRKVYKRIGNLHNDRRKILNLPKDENYQIEVEKNLEKFFSKLKKIKYKDFLELGKFYLSDIHKENRFYGMRIFNFENSSRLYNIMTEVNNLLECGNDEANIDRILTAVLVLEDIFFPNLYNKFVKFIDNPEYMYHHVNSFKMILSNIISGNLIFDELIEKGYFGKDWEDFFLETINGLTEKVFYDPEKINYTPNPESLEAQEAFEDILAVPAYVTNLINLGFEIGD